MRRRAAEAGGWQASARPRSRAIGLVLFAVLAGACRDVEIQRSSSSASSVSSTAASSTSTVTTASTGAGGDGGAGGMGCVPGSGPPGTACNPIATGKRFVDDGHSEGDAIAFDAAGNLAVAGVFFGELGIGGPPIASAGGFTDGFVAKFDGHSLAPQWVRHFGGAGNDKATSIAADAFGNVFVAGGSDDTIDFGGGPRCSKGFQATYLVKLDADGDHLFSECFGGDPSTATSGPALVAVDPSGSPILAGEAGDQVDLGTGPLSGADEIFLAKYTPDGQAVWSRGLGGWDNVGVRSIAVDATGRIAMAGTFNGQLVMDGDVFTSSGQHPDMYVSVLDPTGNVLWTRVLRGTQAAFAGAVAIGPSGRIVVGGAAFHAVDDGGGDVPASGNVAVFDANGGLLWTRAFGSPGIAYGMAADGAGNIAALAIGPPPAPETSDTVDLWAFDPDGVPLGGKTYGSGWGRALAARGDEIAFTGAAFQSIDLGDGPLDGMDGDVFVGIQSPLIAAFQ